MSDRVSTKRELAPTRGFSTVSWKYLLTRSGTFRSTSHHRRFEIKGRPGTTTETRKDCGCSCNEKINCAALVRPRITTDAYPFPGAHFDAPRFVHTAARRERLAFILLAWKSTDPHQLPSSYSFFIFIFLRYSSSVILLKERKYILMKGIW